MHETTVKTAASKFRALLMLGKLAPAQISRLRAAGMLPSRPQYVNGLRKGLANVMRKELTRTREALGRGNVSVVTANPMDSEIEHLATVANGKYIPVSGSTTWHLPMLRFKGKRFRADLHDLLVTWHEMLEHRGRFRSGGGLEFTAPISRYAVELSHNPGVLRGERNLYERIVNQLGGRNPDYARYRVGGSTVRRGDFLEELVGSTFNWRTEGRLRKLLQALERKAIPQDAYAGGMRQQHNPVWGDILRSDGVTTLKPAGAARVAKDVIESAKRLAREHGNKKLVDYLNAYRKTIDTTYGGASLSEYNMGAIRSPVVRQPDAPSSVWNAYLHPVGKRPGR